MKKDYYTVWVGGTEVNDYYLDRDGALQLSQLYIDNGWRTTMARLDRDGALQLSQLYIDNGYDDVNIEEAKEKDKTINNNKKGKNNDK